MQPADAPQMDLFGSLSPSQHFVRSAHVLAARAALVELLLQPKMASEMPTKRAQHNRRAAIGLREGSG